MGPIRRFCAVGLAASLILTGQAAAQTPLAAGGVVINMHDVELWPLQQELVFQVERKVRLVVGDQGSGHGRSS